VAIDLDTGSGLVNVFTSSAGNPINDNNADGGQEQAPWTSPVFTAPNYMLQLGYADNVHGCTAPAEGTTPCFPNPFDGSDGTTAATVFIGNGVSISAAPSCGSNCYDAGALLITGIQQSLPSLSATCMAQLTGQLNVAYSSFIEASGGTPPYTFKLDSGSLPPLLALNKSTGEITGSPTSAGTFNFSVIVSDSSKPAETAVTDDCSITIPPLDLFILKDGPTAVPLGSVFDFTIRVENNGNTSQHQVTVIDQLPADGNFVSSQPSGVASQGVLTISLGDLLPGASTTITVTWRAPQQEVTLVNSATALSTSSSAGPSMAEVSVREGVVAGKLNDVNAIAAGTGLRNRTGNMMNGMKVDGIITIPAVASFDKVQKAFLVWAILFQGDLKDISNKITFEGTVVDGINATPPDKSKKRQSGPLCWADLKGKFDDATVGFVADVTQIVQGKPPNAMKPTAYIVSDPVNGANRVGNPNGNNPTPVYPVTDGASLIVFYTIQGQPKTQALFDFTYDSNWFITVERKFTGVSVKMAPSDLVLVGADGQNNAPDKTQFVGNPNTGGVSSVTMPNLWNGADPLQYGAFKVGNLWDTLQMTRPKVLKQNTDNQTFVVKLLGPRREQWVLTASESAAPFSSHLNKVPQGNPY
jgi:uncharacterized repeat protein (TIGR01451 family)